MADKCKKPRDVVLSVTLGTQVHEKGWPEGETKMLLGSGNKGRKASPEGGGRAGSTPLPGPRRGHKASGTPRCLRSSHSELFTVCVPTPTDMLNMLFGSNFKIKRSAGN